MKPRAAVVLAIIFPQVFILSISPPPPPDCLASVHTCMSDLCRQEQALYDGICDDEACQIKGSSGCNMSIQAVLDQYPSLQGCVCVWEEEEEEELCGSIQALATQCSPKTAQLKRSTLMDWQSSSLINYVLDDSGSCLDRLKTCVSDAVCNRFLAPVLQVCTEEQCDRDSCQQVTHQFYSSMPLAVAQLLVLCECEASDQSCLHMKTSLHSGTCGDSAWICQETIDRCVEDRTCRKLLKEFRQRCWSSEEAGCSDTDLQNDECFTRMDPALILGADPECRSSFLATLGTVLHHPCTCRGIYSKDLMTCNKIHDVFHNRSHFMKSLKKSSVNPSTPPEINQSENNQTWLNDYLLYIFAALLLVGVVIVLPLTVISRMWLLRRKDKTKFHHPQKSSFVVIH